MFQSGETELHVVRVVQSSLGRFATWRIGRAERLNYMIAVVGKSTERKNPPRPRQATSFYCDSVHSNNPLQAMQVFGGERIGKVEKVFWGRFGRFLPGIS